MKVFTLLILLAGIALALLMPLHPPIAGAQPEATPILGEPVIVTPVVPPVPAPAPPTDDLPAATAPASTSAPVPSATTAASAPDACEPNDTPEHACLLPLDTISGPFTFVPDSDQDFFRLNLPQEASIQTVITVRATAGLDLLLSVRQGDMLRASGTYSVTLAPEVAGSVVLRIENRDPRSAAGEQYRIEVRREIMPPPDSTSTTAEPDALENNWSFNTATPIAVGVVYDLNFVCPDPRPDACPGGDHDHLRVPVKAGVRYLLATFDLDPGVDTVVELFWGTITTPTFGNDDYASGGALSALEWVAPTDGLLGVRIAPRNGGLMPHLAEAQTGYRFAVAPLASELARKLEVTIRQQANAPTPTPTSAPVTVAPSGSAGGSTGGSSLPPASPAGSVVSQESIAAGPAIIVAETVLRREPSEGATALTTLAPETRVAVRGPVSGLWVSVESEASILPGWVRWSDLRREAAAPTGTESAETSRSATPVSQQPGAADMPAESVMVSPTPVLERVTLRKLDRALPAPAPLPVARVPFALTVTVAITDRPPAGSATLGFATPTPDLRRPVAQVRVQLLSVFGDLLAEGRTDAAGVTQLRRDVRPGDALLVRIPAWGVELPLATNQTSLILTIPEDAP
jgi:hypothetical protein